MRPWQRFVRILLDTNVLVSALLSRNGPPGRVLDAIREGRHTLISSPYLLNEIREVCSRPHLRNRISVDELNSLLDNMVSVGHVVSQLPDISLSPDPKDNPILATALAGDAELIVSGDKSHMQDLGNIQGIPILAPRDALKLLKPAE